MKTPGIHHVTGITQDPQRNIDFYTGILGLRLVKLTVNFDDPTAYHLYYGNALGEPGTIMTFFSWPSMRRGVRGVGEAIAVSFSIARTSIPFWKHQLDSHTIPYTEEEQFGESVLRFHDPDQLEIELVAEKPLASMQPWTTPSFPAASAIRGIHGVTLCEDESENTHTFLTEHFGYSLDVEDSGITRYRSRARGVARYLSVRTAPDLPRGDMGAGTIHHIAFRAENDTEESAMRDTLLLLGINATAVIDRTYFHSVYFRIPGGILFELATDAPGFAVDERASELGTRLQLPSAYTHYRGEIERRLMPLTLPRYA